MEFTHFRVTVQLASGLTVVHHVDREGRTTPQFIRSILPGFAVAEGGRTYLYPNSGVCQFVVEEVAETHPARTFQTRHDYCASLVNSR